MTQTAQAAPPAPLMLNATALFGKKPNTKLGAFTILLSCENNQKTQQMAPMQACDAKGKPLMANGKPVMTFALAFHWSAGRRRTAWDGYHGGVAYDAEAGNAVIVKCLDWDEKGKHLWGRNSGYFGMSYFAMAEASWGKGRVINFAGPEPIVPAMTLDLAVYAAEVCAWKHIDPRGYHLDRELVRRGAGTPHDRLEWTGRYIVVPNLVDHADMAARDGYAADRGDIGPYKAPLFSHICEVYDGLKAGHRKFQYLELIK